jgi:hypothetical protein
VPVIPTMQGAIDRRIAVQGWPWDKEHKALWEK